MENTTWILGAGFSRPLGGPLLADFFSSRVIDQATAWIATNGVTRKEHSRPFYLLQALFRLGATDGTWLDAEQFLGTLVNGEHSAVDGAVLLNRVKSIGTIKTPTGSLSWEDVTLADLAKWASHYVGAALSSFIPDQLSASIDDVPEDWSPYCSWFDRLPASHSIISFNYDRVIETIADRRKGPMPSTHHMHGVLPAPQTVASLIASDQSVDGLALPGRTKKKLIVGSLGKIWKAADDSVKRAHIIVMIGYSMPRTDAHTRMWLLKHIATRASSTVVLVLGADNPDTKRMIRALSFRHECNVPSTELYTEEYLARCVAGDGLLIS